MPKTIGLRFTFLLHSCRTMLKIFGLLNLQVKNKRFTNFVKMPTWKMRLAIPIATPGTVYICEQG